MPSPGKRGASGAQTCDPGPATSADSKPRRRLFGPLVRLRPQPRRLGIRRRRNCSQSGGSKGAAAKGQQRFK
eukprot:8237473-Alexandrium_andersonii.AAC.1